MTICYCASCEQARRHAEIAPPPAQQTQSAPVPADPIDALLSDLRNSARIFATMSEGAHKTYAEEAQRAIDAIETLRAEAEKRKTEYGTTRSLAEVWRCELAAAEIERDAAKADLAKLKAERDRAVAEAVTLRLANATLQADLAKLHRYHELNQRPAWKRIEAALEGWPIVSDDMSLCGRAVAAIEAAKRKPMTVVAPGLSMSVGSDGCWLHFTTDASRYASYHVATRFPGDGFADRVVREWCQDREDERRKALPAVSVMATNKL